jgi:hypothetical protein
MWPAGPTPGRGQVRIRFAGPSRQPLLLTQRFFGQLSNLLVFGPTPRSPGSRASVSVSEESSMYGRSYGNLRSRRYPSPKDMLRNVTLSERFGQRPHGGHLTRSYTPSDLLPVWRTQTNAEVELRAAAAQRLKSVVRSCLTPKPPKTPPLSESRSQSPVNLRVLEDLALFLRLRPRWAPEKDPTLLGSSIFWSIRVPSHSRESKSVRSRRARRAGSRRMSMVVIRPLCSVRAAIA